MCEAFGCLPSEAVREIEQGDRQLVERVMLMRSYEQAYRVYKDTKESEWPEGMRRLLELVKEFDFARVREEMSG